MFFQWITGFGFYIGSWTFWFFMVDVWIFGFYIGRLDLSVFTLDVDPGFSQNKPFYFIDKVCKKFNCVNYILTFVGYITWYSI